MKKIQILNQEDGINELARHFSNRCLIPFFGAGFTFGLPCAGGVVPDSEKCVELMSDLLIKHGGYTYSGIMGKEFKKIAEYFYDMAPEVKSVFFIDYFTKVRMDEENIRRQILNMKWPYAYTLNIDDGIESNSDFYKTLPYHGHERTETIKRLFKIHGDAAFEATQKGEHIIFNSQQYILSLTKEENTDMLRALENVFRQLNLVFIGCSLKDEEDIKHIYKKVQNDSNEVDRYIVLKEPPKDKPREHELESHGINKVIRVDSYDDFYAAFKQALEDAAPSLHDLVHKNPNVEFLQDKDGTFQYLKGTGIYDARCNKFSMGGMYIERSIMSEIIEAINRGKNILIDGGRFSGKTSLLAGIISKISNKTIYFFPSTESVDESILEELFVTERDALFIFDNNSVMGGSFRYVIDSTKILSERRNQVVMAMYSEHVMEKLNAEAFQLSKYFDKNECQQNEQQGMRYSLLKRERKFFEKHYSNIDYLLYLSQQQKVPDLLSELPEISGNFISDKQKKLLLLLAICDKVYSSDAFALNAPLTEFRAMEKKFERVIEVVPVGKNETNRHSGDKIVHNSLLYLREIIKNFSKDEIVGHIYSIVELMANDKDRAQMQREMIKFDNLNDIFGDIRGSGSLIFSIYEKLEDVLYKDFQYWLQRAKSMYRLKYDDVGMMQQAYVFAQKVYTDGYGRHRDMAALELAIICSSLYEHTGEVVYQEDTIKYAHAAVTSLPNIDQRLEIKHHKFRENILQICKNYVGDIELRRHAEEIFVIIQDKFRD